MRRGRGWRVALLVLVLILSACGRSPPTESLLRRGNGPEPDSLDPALAQTDSAANILNDVYEGLTVREPDGRVGPGVAERWRVSADGRVVTFTLRASARWSNAEAVVAGDYVASWRRLVDPHTASPYGAFLAPVDGATEILAGQRAPDTLGVTAPDARTLVVRLKEPMASFAALTAHWSTFATPKGRPPGPPGSAVTNGAYVPVAWKLGDAVEARRNRAYWNDAATHIERVRYLHIPDPLAEYRRFRAGDLDVTYTLPQLPYEGLRARHGDALRIGPMLGLYYYGFDLTRPPFRDAPGLRRALAMVVDRERLVTAVTGLGEAAAVSFVPPGMPDYVSERFDWADVPLEARLAEARRLYRAAGFGPSHPLVLSLVYPTGSAHQRVALALAAMWKDGLGLEVQLTAMDQKRALAAVSAHEAPMFRSSWIADYADPATFLDTLASDSGLNLVGYRNAAYDVALATAHRASGAARTAAFAAAERQMLGDTPLIPLYFYVTKHLVAANVIGWRTDGLNLTLSRMLALKPRRIVE
jgi:oligopeptide transport system substrate-binding protein